MALRLVLPLLVLLAACAAPPAEQGLVSDGSAGASETEQRARARLHTELAASYFEIGNLNVALDEALVATRADPNYGPAFNVLAIVYARLKEDRLAEQNFDRALKINPVDSDANNNYGSFLCDRKREEEAIRHFLAALRNPLYQTPERSYINAGVCSRRRGDLTGAQDYFQLALKTRPNLPIAMYQLADIAFARGDTAAARAQLAQFFKLVANPGPETLWLGLRVSRKLGDTPAESSYAQQLRRNFPQSRETRALEAGQFE